MEGLLRVENFSYAYPGRKEWTLRDIDLEVGAGQCHCLTGPTGCGKTTLALALKGLLPPGRRGGRIISPTPRGADRAGVGLVLQNPETQMLTGNLGAEVAFGLENLCLPPGQMLPRVRTALAATGLALPLEHSTSRLSMGQKYRLLIAAQLVMDPALLVLDEPGGQLDPAGLESLTQVIGRLKKEGVSVLLCEHRPGPLAPLIDRYWRLTPSGEVRSGCAPSLKPPAPRRRSGLSPEGETSEVVCAHDLGVDVRDASPAWEGACLALKRGQRSVLRGPNGCGKTTLLRCLAGFLRTRKGEVRVFGEPPEPARLRGRVGYLFQNPGRQLFETTVREEVAFALRRCGFRRDRLAERITQTLAGLGIAHLADRSPHQLSYGQKHLVALGAILAPRPQLLLLDDPFAGLDGEQEARVFGLLATLTEEEGTALLWTSHEETGGPDWADLTLVIEGDRLVQR